jgi:hypothetical protein
MRWIRSERMTWGESSWDWLFCKFAIRCISILDNCEFRGVWRVFSTHFHGQSPWNWKESCWSPRCSRCPRKTEQKLIMTSSTALRKSTAKVDQEFETHWNRNRNRRKTLNRNSEGGVNLIAWSREVKNEKERVMSVAEQICSSQ